jgi:hypothetical protein
MAPKSATRKNDASSAQPNATLEESSSELEQLLQDKFGGCTLRDALREGFRPTVRKDLTQAEDHRWIPEISSSPDARALENALDDAVDTFIGMLTAWSPVYWYVQLQRCLCKQQFQKWKQTADDLKAENRRDRRSRNSFQLIWAFIRSFSNFIRHFRKYPWASLVVILLLTWWECTTILAFPVSYRLDELAYFVGAAATNSRSQVLIISVLRHRNVSPLVVLRYANKRGLTPFASLVAYCIPAFDDHLRYLYADDQFVRSVIGIASVWSNLIFFYSEISFLLVLLFSLSSSWISPLSQEDCDDLASKCRSLAAARLTLNKLKKTLEHKVSCLTRDEIDSLLQNSGYISKLLKISSEPETFINIRFRLSRKLFEDTFLLVLLILPKIMLLCVTGAFVFLQIYPFRDQYLLFVSKTNWGIQVIIKMLECLPQRRSMLFMFDQCSYLVLGAIYQVVAISFPTLKDKDFLRKKKWFFSVLFSLIITTNWITELPGDLAVWSGARLGLWSLRLAERKLSNRKGDLELPARDLVTSTGAL